MTIFNEDDYRKWENYPPGTYWASELLQPPHPKNTCSYDSDGYPVLVVLDTEVKSYPLRTPDKRKQVDRVYAHKGFVVMVWLPRTGAPVTSRRGVVKSLDNIDDMVEKLKAEVDGACLHPNSTPVPNPYPMNHEFVCDDCGEAWGYDSSG